MVGEGAGAFARQSLRWGGTPGWHPRASRLWAPSPEGGGGGAAAARTLRPAAGVQPGAAGSPDLTWSAQYDALERPVRAQAASALGQLGESIISEASPALPPKRAALLLPRCAGARRIWRVPPGVDVGPAGELPWAAMAMGARLQAARRVALLVARGSHIGSQRQSGTYPTYSRAAARAQTICLLVGLWLSAIPQIPQMYLPACRSYSR